VLVWLGEPDISSPGEENVGCGLGGVRVGVGVGVGGGGAIECQGTSPSHPILLG